MPEPIEREYTAQTQVGKQFLHDLRHFMRDTREFNNLLDEEEVDDSALILATRLMISDYVSMPPLLRQQVNLEFFINNGLLSPAIYLTASHVLASKFQQQERNFLQYSDGGRTEAVNDKAEAYKSSMNMFKTIAERKFLEFKVATNLMSGYNRIGVTSDYRYVDDYI